MIKVTIDNTPVYTPANTTLLEACEKLGIYVPRFCYHERLRVAGNCRMCLLEVEKAPKPVVSCAFPINNGMNVFTSSPLVRKARENVIEFLLINHPYDCPICDQGGECDLQEQTLKYGSDRSRFNETKRTVEDKNVGAIVKTIMTRCIHCTRCVRFLELVAGTEEFGTTVRGRDTEIGTYVNKKLTTELSGNLIDLCPVGALTSKPYAFSARPWELKNISTVDISDAIGSHITVGVKESTIVRVTPTICDEINGEWISDKTRFSFDGFNNKRLSDIYYKTANDDIKSITWRQVIDLLTDKISSLTNPSEEILLVAGNNLDQESYYLLKLLNKYYQINLINEEESCKLSPNLLEEYKLNTPLTKMEEADFFLGIGVNPRFEGSLFNVRLRNNFVLGLTNLNFVGVPEDLTYSHRNWDNALTTLTEIGEGRHPLCVALSVAAKPILLSGGSKLNRQDFGAFQSIYKEISKHTNLITESWMGINFLPTTPNFVGKIKENSIRHALDLRKIKMLFLCQLDKPTSFYKKVNAECLKVVMTPIVLENFFTSNTLLLPVTTSFETVSEFTNLEERLQKTRVVNASSFTNTRSLQSLCKLFINIFDKTQSISASHSKQSTGSVFDPSLKDWNFFFKLTNSQHNQKRTIEQFIENVPLKPVMMNFYKTNLASENSTVMSECSKQFLSNFSNFHLYNK